MKTPKWYIANLITHPVIKDPKTKKIIKYKKYSYCDNLTLIKAKNSEAAYKKALVFGKDMEHRYINTDDEIVESRFDGVAELDEVFETLEDGNQITYSQGFVKNLTDIKRLIPKKENLRGIAWERNISLEKKK